MKSEIDLRRVVFIYNTVFAVSRNSFKIVVITFVPVPLQSPATPQITLVLLLLLLLLLMPDTFENNTRCRSWC